MIHIVRIRLSEIRNTGFIKKRSAAKRVLLTGNKALTL